MRLTSIAFRHRLFALGLTVFSACSEAPERLPAVAGDGTDTVSGVDSSRSFNDASAVDADSVDDLDVAQPTDESSGADTTDVSDILGLEDGSVEPDSILPAADTEGSLDSTVPSDTAVRPGAADLLEVETLADTEATPDAASPPDVDDLPDADPVTDTFIDSVATDAPDVAEADTADPSCAAHADCDDGDPCTVDRCIADAYCENVMTACRGAWPGVLRPLPKSPYDNPVLVVTPVDDASASAALDSGADGVAVDAATLSAVGPLLSSSDCLVVVRLTSTDSVAASLGVLRGVGLAAPGRPAILSAPTASRARLIEARDLLAGADADLAPFVRLVERFSAGQSGNISTYQTVLIRAAADDGFDGVTVSATDVDVFGKLGYARSLGLWTGVDSIPLAGGPALLTALRDRVDLIVTTVPPGKARAIVSARDARVRVDTADGENVGGAITWQASNRTPRAIALTGDAAPVWLTWGAGQDFYGGVLEFVRDAGADSGDLLDLGKQPVPAGAGLVLALAVNFDKIGADLAVGENRHVAGDSQAGGYYLKLERDAAGAILEFGVHVGGSYRIAATDADGLNGDRSYHLVGVYDRESGAVSLLVDGVIAATTSGAPGDVTASSLNLLVGADPQPEGPRYFFDGKLQRVIVATPGPMSCTSSSACAAPPCGTATCNLATGHCEVTPPVGKCAIGGSCVDAGVNAPNNQCLVCDPARDLSAWSPGGPSLWCAGPDRLADLRWTVRTSALTNSGTHDLIRACVGPGACSAFDTFPWAYWNENSYQPDDLESLGQIDLQRRPVALPLAGLDGLSLDLTAQSADASVAVNGSDAWRPGCVSAVLDGELVYCRDDFGSLLIGSEDATGEVPRWVDPNATVLGCGGCYPGRLSHGPMIGRTTSDSALIWVRTEFRRTVVVRYGPANAGLLTSGAFESDPRTTEPDEDFVLLTALDGLEPGTVYAYEVWVDGALATQAGLTFKTAPTGPAKTAIAFGSCIKHSTNPAEPIFGQVQAIAPDLMLLVGDNHYGNRPDYDNLVFHLLRERAVASQAAVLARTPTLAIWDDHDFAGNNTYGANVPKRTESLSAFSRYWANGSFGEPGQPGVYSKHRHGAVEVFMLDTRYHRDPPGTNGDMLGAAQLAWLQDGLAASTATFKVLAAGSRWTMAGSDDSWAEYPTERSLLFDFIADEAISGVVFLSGDIHRVEVRRLDVGQTPYPFWEFVSSPMNNDHGTSCTAAGGDILDYCSAGTTGGVYALLRTDTTVSPATLTYELRGKSNEIMHTRVLSASALAP